MTIKELYIQVPKKDVNDTNKLLLPEEVDGYIENIRRAYIAARLGAYSTAHTAKRPGLENWQGKFQVGLEHRPHINFMRVSFIAQAGGGYPFLEALLELQNGKLLANKAVSEPIHGSSRNEFQLTSGPEGSLALVNGFVLSRIGKFKQVLPEDSKLRH
jgi:hypothetical protein